MKFWGCIEMQEISERLSYLHGLAEGLDIYDGKKEGRFFQELMVFITELNDELTHTKARLTELEEYVEAVDEDLNDLELDYYDEVDFDDLDDNYLSDDDLELDLDEDYLEELVCPNCHEVVVLNSEIEDDEIAEIVCPNCHELFVVENEDE